MRRLILFLGAHVALGASIRAFPAISTAHAVATVLVGLWVALVKRPVAAAYAIAYITGAEVLWRMTHAGVFHEVAKYSIAAIVIVALFRMRSHRNRLTALVFIGLLVPSSLPTMLSPDADIREQLSFNLSGPFALALCVVFFSNLRVTGLELRKLFVSLIGAVLAISTYLILRIRSLDQLVFTGDSNHATSGGFGPNQVSAILGVAVLFALLMMLDRKLPWRLRPLLLVLAGVLATQSALTFSRGGLFLAMASFAPAAIYMVRDARRRVLLLGVGAVVFAMATLVVIPWLQNFTGGAIGERYSDTSATGRSQIAGYDLRIFEDHPLLGVGPGLAIPLRQEMGREAASHTEYTRLLAEHGLFGAAAICVLFWLAFRTYRRARGLEARALVVATIGWSLIFLAVYGTRIAAPSVMFGIGCAVSVSSIASKPRR